MFKELGALARLPMLMPKIKEEMERLQQRIGEITADGDAGAGMVKVRVNGKMEVLACTLSEEAFKSGDREFLEDLIKSATNGALDKARQRVQEETAKMASELGLPAGMALPGLGG